MKRWVLGAMILALTLGFYGCATSPEAKQQEILQSGKVSQSDWGKIKELVNTYHRLEQGYPENKETTYHQKWELHHPDCEFIRWKGEYDSVEAFMEYVKNWRKLAGVSDDAKMTYLDKKVRLLDYEDGVAKVRYDKQLKNESSEGTRIYWKYHIFSLKKFGNDWKIIKDNYKTKTLK